MTATASTLSADPAPISSSSNFYMAALNHREEEEKKKRGVILRMEIATLKEALENGPPPQCSFTGDRGIKSATAMDANDSMTLGKGVPER